MLAFLRTCVLSLLALFATQGMAQRNVYSYSAYDYKGEKVSLSNYRGQVMLIVNTATQCGFTPQYEALEQLYRTYRDQGFVVLDFPCNQFGGQAPGTSEEINGFCTNTYATTFPRMQKIEVNGEGALPLYHYLKRKCGFIGFDRSTEKGERMHQMMMKRDPHYAEKSDIKWNFTKFLIDRRGRVVKRFEPTAPLGEIAYEVKRLLK